MNRAAALVYMQSEYSALSVESNQTVDEAMRGYGIATDLALRVLGFKEVDIPSADVVDILVEPYIALLDYFALARYARLFAVRTNVIIERLAVDGSQLFNQILRLKDAAEQRCADLGYSPSKSLSMGRLPLDFLEPGLGPEFNEGMIW